MAKTALHEKEIFDPVSMHLQIDCEKQLLTLPCLPTCNSTTPTKWQSCKFILGTVTISLILGTVTIS